MSPQGARWRVAETVRVVTDDIAAFIRARLDERQDADWHARTCQTHRTMPPGTPFGLAGSPMSCNCGAPDLVEADVEVKRRIVGLHTETATDTSSWGDTHTVTWCPTCSNDGQCPTLQAMAAEWSTHEDYRSEWTP